MLYFALVFPYLSYCNIVWASNYPSRLNSLHTLHKSLIRATSMFHLSPTTSCKHTFEEFKLLYIYQLNIFQIDVFMFK